ncbi:MAG: GNAT family N-acetyltransferase [Burkholderiaceae bacterium]
MTSRITLGDWPMQRAAAEIIRHEVFIVEQHVPVEMEWDEMDALSVHAIAFDEAGHAIGTGRLLPDGHIGRMAVKRANRKAGIGGAILCALMQEAKKRGDRTVILNAQLQAQAFYERYGFAPEGEEFMDAGIPHILMRLIF